MKLRSLSALSLVGWCVLASVVGSAAAAQDAPTQEPTLTAQGCDVHLYPAEGVHSVGEDFDAVKRVDQDLRDYYTAAGRPLNWLTPDRQLALVGQTSWASQLGVSARSTTFHGPMTRRQALDPGPRASGTGCLVEIFVPQVVLERGGLAKRSLRVFGVIRHYENGKLVRGYSTYASALMPGFALRTPADAEPATQMVEQAYQHAILNLIRNYSKRN